MQCWRSHYLGWQDWLPLSSLWQTLAGSSSQGSPPLGWSAEQGETSSAHRWIFPLVNCWERLLPLLQRSCLWSDRNWARGEQGHGFMTLLHLGFQQCASFSAMFTFLDMRGRCPSCPRTLGLSSGLFSLWSSSSLNLPASSGKTRAETMESTEHDEQLSLRSVDSEASRNSSLNFNVEGINLYSLYRSCGVMCSVNTFWHFLFFFFFKWLLQRSH